MRAYALCLMLTGLAGFAHGQTYPQRQVTLVIPTTVGTAADITARNFAPKLSQKFGRPFVPGTRQAVALICRISRLDGLATFWRQRNDHASTRFEGSIQFAD